MHRRPPRSPRTYTLFPHTPRCRSSFAFKLPDGAQSVGTIRVTLFADRNAGGSGNAVREVADGRNAEGNNSAQATVVAGARTYPDLRVGDVRSEEHTSELQSLMRISYAVFCLKKHITYECYCMIILVVRAMYGQQLL